MQNFRALLALSLGLGLILSLPYSVSLQAQPSLSIPQVNPLAAERLKNASYQIPQIGSITLKNGTYQSPAATNPLSVTMADRIAYGDLNGDGNPEAAVLLAVDTGGSGVFKYLAVVEAQKGQPVNITTESLGDRVIIKSLALNNGKIKVKLLTHSSTDPMCCPSQEIVQVYRLNSSDNQLITTSLTDEEANPQAPQIQIVPANPLGIGDNTPVQPPDEEIEFRF